MRLDSLVEEQKEDNKKEKGTYLGAKFSRDTQNALKEFMKANKIENPIPRDKMHTTIIYSRKRIDDVEPLGDIDPPWIGKPEKLEIFKTRDNDKNALVLRYKCEKQRKRHEQVMKDYDAQYDWPEYKIHLTLSYDCGFDKVDLDSLTDISSIGNIEIIKEYKEDLELEWLTKK